MKRTQIIYTDFKKQWDTDMTTNAHFRKRVRTLSESEMLIMRQQLMKEVIGRKVDGSTQYRLIVVNSELYRLTKNSKYLITHILNYGH